MKKFFLNSTNILDTILFIARVCVVLVFVILITLYFGQPPATRNLNPFSLPRYETLMMLSFYVALLGLLISWGSEGFGGFVTLGGLVAFSVIDYLATGHILWNIWILAIPALLFILYWWYTNVSENFDVYRS